MEWAELKPLARCGEFLWVLCVGSAVLVRTIHCLPIQSFSHMQVPLCMPFLSDDLLFLSGNAGLSA